jgi:outer membrane cobalamin receptor
MKQPVIFITFVARKEPLKLKIGEQRGPARLSLGFLAQSHRYDDAANTQRLGGYGIFNVNGEYNFDKIGCYDFV